MARFLALFFAALLALPLSGQEAREVAVQFATAYESGDPAAACYVFFNGKHVGDMGGTPEELENDLLPEELRKNKKNPATVEMLECVFSPADAAYGCDVWYAVYLARGKKHKLCLYRIDGQWKVDLSYLWMGDWYDWMPGY